MFTFKLNNSCVLVTEVLFIRIYHSTDGSRPMQDSYRKRMGGACWNFEKISSEVPRSCFVGVA